MSSVIKGFESAPSRSVPYQAAEERRSQRASGERPIAPDPSKVPEVGSAQAGLVQNALERFQDKVQLDPSEGPAARTEVESPLELLSVQVLAELKSVVGQMAPHEPQEPLISITLRAIQLDRLQTQVTRVSSSGVATDMDLIGQGEGADLFSVNGVTIRNSSAADDPLSYEAKAQSAIAKAAAINASALETHVRAVALPTRTDKQATLNEELGGEAYGNLYPVRGFRPAGEAQLIINGVDVQLGIYADRDETGELITKINAVTPQTGVVGSINEDGELVLESPDGRNISVHYEGPRGDALSRAIGLRASGEHPYGGRIALVSFREITLNLGREVNYALGDIAGDFSVMEETYYSH